MNRAWKVLLLVSISLCCLIEAFRLDTLSDKRAEEPAKDDDLRLPRTVVPRLYNLKMIPILEEDNFTTIGSVEIILDCVEKTDSITLHSLEINITTVVIKDVSGNNIKVSNIENNDKSQTVTIKLSKTLKTGSEYILSMDFTYTLNDQLKGLYRSSYQEDGKTKYLAVTHMEPLKARRAFPCFDEPNFKANFSITLGRKEKMTAASNMPSKKTLTKIDGMEGYEWEEFETSFEMSTYLVAMMVSELESIKSNSSLSNVDFHVWARPSAKGQTAYARNIGPRVLEAYEKYFGIDFPLPKQDMAAIPDFGPGAMENWGFITYKEAFLLYDETKSSAADKQAVCETIAHELAHQWFGNLVTMDWWNAVWLNEGFAQYMQYIGTDSVEQTFKMDEQFLVKTLQSIMKLDALDTSRPINVDVTTIEEIGQQFDTISYDKGASVIRMLANFLGNETFGQGLTNYLKEKAYQNAIQDDLWNTLEVQAAIDDVTLPESIKNIMDTWTLQKGFPLITVIRDYENEGAEVKQERFLYQKSNTTEEYLWWVPLTFTSDFSNTPYVAWISGNVKSKSLITLNAFADQWVIFNVDQVGFYRVAYDETNYKMISEQLINDHEKISVKNRAQLMDDILNLARANLTSYNQALNLTLYLSKERSYIPWKAALNELSYLDDMLYNSHIYDRWKKYITSLVIPLYEDVKFNEDKNDEHLLIFTRDEAANWACKLGNEDCIEKALTYYALWMEDPASNPFTPNQKRLVVCTAIENGGEEEWNFAYRKYKESSVANEKATLLNSMACTKDENVLNNMLELMINPGSGIRLEDSFSVFDYVSNNPIGNLLALTFLETRWEDINDYFRGSTTMDKFFASVSRYLNVEEQRDRLLKLKMEHSFELESSAYVKRALETVDANINWMNYRFDEVVDWLPSSAVRNQVVIFPFILICLGRLQYLMM